MTTIISYTKAKIDSLLAAVNSSITGINNSITALNKMGYVAEVAGTAHTGIGGSLTTINNAYHGFTAEAGRRYKITAVVQVRQRTSTGLVSIVIANTTTSISPEFGTTLATDAYATITVSTTHLPGAVPVTYGIRAKTSANTVDITAGAILIVEDIT